MEVSENIISMEKITASADGKQSVLLPMFQHKM